MTLHCSALALESRDIIKSSPLQLDVHLGEHEEGYFNDEGLTGNDCHAIFAKPRAVWYESLRYRMSNSTHIQTFPFLILPRLDLVKVRML